jgi:hypothetical protein
MRTYVTKSEYENRENNACVAKTVGGVMRRLCPDVQVDALLW